MEIFMPNMMALVAVECAEPTKGSDIHYVSISTNQEETNEELKECARQYLAKEYPHASAQIVIKLTFEEYEKILKNQLQEYFLNK